MQLTYRGNFYQVPAPIQFDFNSIEQPKIQLVYRGNAIDYMPRSVMISGAGKTDCPTMNLIYRGNSYERELQPTTHA